MAQKSSVRQEFPAKDLRQSRKASLAAFFGGMLEYYDFMLFASAAALIFPRVIFGSGQTATLMSLATFGVAYVARPLGAVLIGHIGDKIGRKNALIFTLMMMGASTLLIGCLPTFDQVGMLAPVLLVILRVVQGFSAGGETAGASSLSVEHAPENRRAFFGSWTINGIGAGIVLASLAFIPVTALPDEALFSWGWRIPFLASIFVFFVAFLIRRTLEEPEVFEEIKESAETAKVPLIEAFRLNWQGIVRVGLAMLFAVLNTVTAVFGLSFAVGVGVDRTTMLWVAASANVLGLLVRPFAGMLADKIGRKPVFIVGTLGSGLMIFFYFMTIEAGNMPLLFLVNLLMTGLLLSAADAVYPAFFAEMFSAKIRYTGMAVGLQFGLLASGFAPTIGSALLGGVPNNWGPVAWMTLICSVIATASALSAKETFSTPLRELGITPQLRKRNEREAALTAASSIDSTSETVETIR